MSLYPEYPANSGEAKVGTPGPIMYQVGSEGGFLPAVAIHDNGAPIPLDLKSDPSGNTAFPDGPFNLLLAPAERADVVIDFNGVPARSTFILFNDAPGPFPGKMPETTTSLEMPTKRSLAGRQRRCWVMGRTPGP